jgi:hypothetical protein
VGGCSFRASLRVILDSINPDLPDHFFLPISHINIYPKQPARNTFPMLSQIASSQLSIILNLAKHFPKNIREHQRVRCKILSLIGKQDLEYLYVGELEPLIKCPEIVIWHFSLKTCCLTAIRGL